jgi:23S rRNA (cytosine1962-C5)-methyltransferase
MTVVELLSPPAWPEYELLDAGGGQKLERYGPYRLVRPEAQAIWEPALPKAEWERADAFFQRGSAEDGPGQWVLRRTMPEQWLMHHHNLAFWVRLTPFKHTGVFPEHSAHWGWIRRQLASTRRQPNVLVLFGYTGLSTLLAAQVGARVCHVDASKPATRWAQENQAASGLEDRPIRWIVDDVSKFVARELRRGSRYDLILMDPPAFGRGPKGEIWRLNEALPALVAQAAELLSEEPLGLLASAYATNISSLTLRNVLAGAMRKNVGSLTAGELVLKSSAANQPLSAAIFACWSSS